ncbi:PHA/PHB synthase family protein [Marinobacter sp. X15-166B]|uniref:PHA/PHB synthase family protein n=1 Tax=Marinobacter sp. X15-166B TaxID=1897620 RepID=UPI00085C9A60|nr:class I poly(R)-hydroxyalkanoic acid synthase [Marinobacter sp. X15-166B]OEY65694.1 hypothetical protein BG841_03965 [Marinobacter sp. X15-166B]
MTTDYKDYTQRLFQQYSRFMNELITSGGTPADSDSAGQPTPSGLTDARIDTDKLIRHQFAYLGKQLELWQSMGRAMHGGASEPVVSEDKGDRRFGDEDWSTNPLFSFIKQSYLLNSRLLTDMLDSVEFKDDSQSDKLKFLLRQYINAVSPSNTLLANPEVYRTALETNGESVHKGLTNLFSDLQQSSRSALKLTQTDESGFVVGETLATTPGSVVYQNEIMQLIQYAPTTKQVYATPLLITPPYINKYYVMDLDEKKSLVRWLVGKGFTVFMISWVNPGAELAHKSFSDYVTQGPVEALEVVRDITGEDKVSLVGYCVGGTISSLTAALLKAQGKDHLASLTLLTTLLDFSNPGEVGHFLSESTWPRLKQEVQNTGYMDGRSVALGFNLLRENQLFWPYVINNYLKGKTPQAFDILYWNSDNTHIPATNYIEYLENTYLHNRLIEPGAVEIDGTPIDVSSIDVPVYVLATRADHIVLWEAAYQSMQALSSAPIRFVLAESGHLAGVINPEKGGKYGHRTNPDTTGSAAAWFAAADEQTGSWWPDWFAWAQQHFAPSSADMTSARQVGNTADYPELEPAPGSYVRKRV